VKPASGPVAPCRLRAKGASATAGYLRSRPSPVDMGRPTLRLIGSAGGELSRTDCSFGLGDRYLRTASPSQRVNTAPFEERNSAQLVPTSTTR
jgi:hypothetical protein